MFTIDQIKNAHSKVRSGADFPAYIGKMKQLGVTRYTRFVSDGATEYSAESGQQLRSSARSSFLAVSSSADKVKLAADLKTHQAGGSDFITFCRQAADAGVAKWTVDLVELTCTYYDLEDQIMLVETIPDPI